MNEREVQRTLLSWLNQIDSYTKRASRTTEAKTLTQTTSHLCHKIHSRLLKETTSRIYLYFKVWKVERCPEQRAEVGYGRDFPPGLDLFHRNCTSLGHFRSREMVLGLILTLESSFLRGLQCRRNITNTTKVATTVLYGLLPLLQSASITISPKVNRWEGRHHRTKGGGSIIQL